MSFSRSSFSSADLHAFFALPIAVAKKRYETPDGSAAYSIGPPSSVYDATRTAAPNGRMYQKHV